MRALGLVFVSVALGAVACEDGGLTQVPGTDAGVVERCFTDEDCGEFEVCTVGVCVSQHRCGPDDPCENPEQVCEVGPNGYRICVFTRCEEASECQDLECDPNQVAACVAGGCICGEPCQGGCPFGQGCCIPTDICQDLPDECMGLTCPPGEFVSVTSTGAWSAQACEFLGETCACERLPPLPEGDIGLYSAMAHDGRGFVLSAYNLTYGDLMFGLVQNDGSVAWEFVDGVPTSTGADGITGDVMGPRRGQSQPGPDTGIYTDVVAASDNTPHIAYQNRDDGALEHAMLTTRGWQKHRVDGAGMGDTGRYASIVVDAQDRPIVAYLSAREEVSGSRLTRLRLAVANTPTPANAADWGLRTLESVDLSGEPCAERCNVTEVCLRNNDRCVVPSPDSACSPRCQSREACINGTCEPTRSLPPFMELPRARGLWPSVALLPNGDALVAYHDRIDLSLKLAHIAGPDLLQGAISITTLEGRGAPGGGTDETGLYPSLFVTAGGEIHLAYMNVTRQALRYRALDGQFGTTLAEDVESGIGVGGGPDGELLGADPALVVDAGGRVRIAYQNATLGDLRYARREASGAWTLLTLAGDEVNYSGTFGFYTDQALDAQGANPRVSTYRYFLSAGAEANNGLSLFSAP